MPTLAASLVTAAALPAAAAGHHPPPPVSLQAANFRFCATGSTCLPERDDNHVTTVPVGTRITWTYQDTACDLVVPCPGHNVVFTNGRGNRTLVKTDGGVILRMTFTRPGTYSYYCSAHKTFGMTGTIVVTPR